MHLLMRRASLTAFVLGEVTGDIGQAHDNFFDYFKDLRIRFISLFPQWMRQNGLGHNSFARIVLAIVILLLGFALRRLIAKLLYRWVSKVKVKGLHIGEGLNRRLMPVLLWFLPLAAWHLAIVNTLSWPQGMHNFLSSLTKSAWIVLIAAFFARVITGIIDISARLGVDKNFGITKTLQVFYSRLARSIIYILALIAIFSAFGINVAGLLTGLGLGGLAISLAAKEMLTNLIAGLALLSEKSFEIGDLVSIQDVEGTVENIGFRATSIRCYDQSLAYVPNATLADNPLYNISKMEKRRVRLILPLSGYMAGDDIDRLTDAMREYLLTRPLVFGDQITLRVDNVEAEGPSFLAMFYLKSTEWSDMMAEKEMFLKHVWRELEKLDLTMRKGALEIYWQGDAEIFRDSGEQGA